MHGGFLNFGKRALLLAAAAGPIMAGGASAIAQTAEEASSGPTIDTIIVEAQRREQAILDVPVAVTAYDNEALEAQNIESILDFNAANPSLFSQTLSDPIANTPVRIRGIGTTGQNPGFEGSVGMYVDGVYRSRAGTALLTFFDMAGVEVLRGPQGTLFGRNNTAGAILQRTAAPELGENNGRITASFGNYGARRVDGHVNLATSDNTALRLAALFTETDGFSEDAVTGDNLFFSETTAVRGSFAFEPRDNFGGRITLDWSRFENPNNDARSYRLSNLDLNGLNNTVYPAFAADTSTGGCGFWYWTPGSVTATPPFSDAGPANPFDRQTCVNTEGKGELEQKGLAVDLQWDINGSVTLRSITGAREVNYANVSLDADFGPTDFSGGLTQFTDLRSFSQEFLLEGDAGPLDFILGANYFTEEIDIDREVLAGGQLGAYGDILLGLGGTVPLNVLALNDAPLQQALAGQNEDTFGVFAHGTWSLTDRLALIAGVRWNKIDKDGFFDNTLGATRAEHGQIISSTQGFLFFLNGSAVGSPDWTSSISNDEFTYDITLQFRPTDNTQLYAKYARGFKAGGLNLQIDAIGGAAGIAGPFTIGGVSFNPVSCVDAADAVAQVQERFDDCDAAGFAPEFVDSYELSFRWEYLDRGRLSVTGFLTEYDDLQVSVFNGQVFNVTNAGSSDTIGIEIENTFVVSDSLIVNAAATVLEAQYGDDVPGLPAGRDLGSAPEVAAAVGFQYDQPINEWLSFYSNGNYSFTGRHFVADDIEPTLVNVQQSAYSLVSVAAGLRTESGWDAQVFCRNCLNEDYVTFGFNHVFHFGGSPLVNLGDPRTFGIRLRKTFN